MGLGKEARGPPPTWPHCHGKQRAIAWWRTGLTAVAVAWVPARWCRAPLARRPGPTPSWARGCWKR